MTGGLCGTFGLGFGWIHVPWASCRFMQVDGLSMFNDNVCKDDTSNLTHCIVEGKR